MVFLLITSKDDMKLNKNSKVGYCYTKPGENVSLGLNNLWPANAIYPVTVGANYWAFLVDPSSAGHFFVFSNVTVWVVFCLIS